MAKLINQFLASKHTVNILQENTVSLQNPMSSNVSPNGRTHYTTDNPQTDRKSVTDSKADLVCDIFTCGGY